MNAFLRKPALIFLGLIISTQVFAKAPSHAQGAESSGGRVRLTAEFAPASPAGDCFNVEDWTKALVGKVDRQEAGLHATVTDVRFPDPTHPVSPEWILKYTPELFSMDPLAEDLAKVRQSGCDRLTGTGDADLKITGHTTRSLDLILDQESLRKNLRRSFQEASTSPSPTPIPVPSIGKNQSVGDQIGQIIGQALVYGLAEGLNKTFAEDPRLIDAMIAQIGDVRLHIERRGDHDLAATLRYPVGDETAGTHTVEVDYILRTSVTPPAQETIGRGALDLSSRYLRLKQQEQEKVQH